MPAVAIDTGNPLDKEVATRISDGNVLVQPNLSTRTSAGDVRVHCTKFPSVVPGNNSQFGATNRCHDIERIASPLAIRPMYILFDYAIRHLVVDSHGPGCFVHEGGDRGPWDRWITVLSSERQQR